MKTFNYTLAITFFLIAVAGAAQAQQSTLAPASPTADTISNLSWFVYVLFTVIGLVMWALLWRVATRRRGTFDEHEPVGEDGVGTPWVTIGGLAIPVVVLGAIFILGVRTLAKFSDHDHGTEMTAPEIRVIGHQWWWEVRYIGGALSDHFATANEIHIPVGQTVTLELSSADVIHSFWVPNLGGKVDLIPGHPNRMRLRADRPGLYRGQCAEFCGTQHATMRMLVVAQPADAFAAWRSNQMAAASAPRTAQEVRGQELFMSRPCVLCHTIRGTEARGQVAPDLTHLASRRGLAANALANDRSSLAAWVTHAQTLKPAAGMPNVTQFSGEQVLDLVSYLEQLR